MQTVAQVKKRIDYLLERDHATDAEIEEVYNQAIDTFACDRERCAQSLCC